MRKVLAIAASVVSDALRRKVVWVVVVFAALLALAIPSLPSYGVGVVDSVFKQVAIALMYAGGLVVALTLASTRIPVEVERRTVFNVISRDVRRWQYVLGTWLGMFAVMGIVMFTFAVATVLIGLLTYPSPMWLLFEAAFAVWLEMGVIMAFTVMLSTQVGAVVGVIGGLSFAFIGHAVLTFFQIPETQATPLYLPTLDIFNVINAVSLGRGVSFVYLVAMLVAFCAWVSLFMIGGSALFSRRDL